MSDEQYPKEWIEALIFNAAINFDPEEHLRVQEIFGLKATETNTNKE